MIKVMINLPNHDNWMAAVSSINPEGDKLNRIGKTLALHAESAMKEMIMKDSKHPTGKTAASIEFKTAEIGQNRVVYHVGSWSRGFILKMIDRGRGEVKPTHLRRTGGMGALKFKIGGAGGVTVFRQSAKPAPGKNYLARAMQITLSKLDNIVKKEMMI